VVELTLVRHGQAQTGATDEASYDSLSDLGHQQARWLGAGLRDLEPYDRIVSGTLTRQIETAQSMGLAGVAHETDARLNELDYFGLAESLRMSQGIEIPRDIQSFALHVPQVLQVWKSGEMHPDLETYEQFCDRITGALHDVAADGRRSLLVTSTGVISTLTALALGLDTLKKSKVFLRVMNTSVHKFELENDDLHLAQFGAVAHLEHPDRKHARTYG
jgi:broad specificity phosphatase PhoE